uniref:rRNA-processing protein fcf2 n=1 Tax=Lygus hesperus TaxID=30085 RepID=A0A0A9VTU6_LYGHE
MPKIPKSSFDFRSDKPLTDIEGIMKHSTLTSDLAKLHQLPSALKRDKKKEKPKVRLLPPEVLTDLKVLRMRSVLDTKRFYKRSSLKSMTNDVQVGKVVDSPADFYSSRLTNKQRKSTLVDELLADQEFKKEVKKRYVNIVTTNKRKFKKAYRQIQQKDRSAQKKLNTDQKKSKKKK